MNPLSSPGERHVDEASYVTSVTSLIRVSGMTAGIQEAYVDQLVMSMIKVGYINHQVPLTTRITRDSDQDTRNQGTVTFINIS